MAMKPISTIWTIWATRGATVAWATVATTIAATSCQRKGESSESRAGITEITVAPMIMNDDAAMVLARARCDRERACDKIGAYRRFSNDDACLRELFAEANAVVNPQACPAGVDETRLSRCVGEVPRQPCEGPRATAPAPPMCTRAALCSSHAMP